MKKSFLQFSRESFQNFGEAIINLFIFLPYFFSVSKLLKTFFSPWKNLQSKKTARGFSFSDLGNRLIFNLISSSIGAMMRLSIVSFYFIFQTLLMVGLPFISLVFFFSLPFLYAINLFKQSPELKKQDLKDEFIKDHLIKNENRKVVEDWFESYYQKHVEKTHWWKLKNLFDLPPLARDWSVGYTPALDEFVIDLATPTYLHHINNIIDREKEIKEIEQVLSKNSEANVVIVGEEGVGKHTIIDALAKKIYLGKSNIHLMYRRILKLNMEKVLNKFADQEQRENFFEELLDEAAKAKNIILFIDNIDKYLDFSLSIEKYGKTDSLQFIGVTTPFSYQKEIISDEKINRLFTKIDVFEVNKKEALEILLEKVFEFETYHRVVIPYETLVEAIDKSEFYLTYIPFPEKAIDLLDDACVVTRTNNPRATNSPKVTPETIDSVLAEKTHIQITITKQLKDKLLNLENLLSSEVLDQTDAIEKLSAALRRSFLLVGKRKKPLASFLFLGPTGVGKTATAKAISQVFFTSQNDQTFSALIRFDMANFQSKYDIPKLIGDRDADEPGLLTAAVREKPYGVLLLDELEKADKNLLNIFLTITDEGYFTDGFGKRVDCKNLVVIATSNAKTQDTFSPEFLNRFDGVVTFNSISKNTLILIAKKIIDTLEKDVYQLYQVKIKIKDSTINQLIEKDYDPRYGARNIERVISDEIEDRVAKLILKDKTKPGDEIIL
ncbi:AAA family ATPase [Patescibacteria group bacterium]|nr:AAA family ATPase [Patescibacteria group bacterium]